MILHLNTIYEMRFSRKHSAGRRACVGTALASTSREAPTREKSWLTCMNTFTELLWQHTKQDCSQRNLHCCQRYLSFQPGWAGALQVEFQWMEESPAATQQSCHTTTSTWSQARAQPTTGLAGPAERQSITAQVTKRQTST